MSSLFLCPKTILARSPSVFFFLHQFFSLLTNSHPPPSTQDGPARFQGPLLVASQLIMVTLGTALPGHNGVLSALTHFRWAPALCLCVTIPSMLSHFLQRLALHF